MATRTKTKKPAHTTNEGRGLEVRQAANAELVKVKVVDITQSLIDARIAAAIDKLVADLPAARGFPDRSTVRHIGAAAAAAWKGCDLDRTLTKLVNAIRKAGLPPETAWATANAIGAMIRQAFVEGASAAHAIDRTRTKRAVAGHKSATNQRHERIRAEYKKQSRKHPRQAAVEATAKALGLSISTVQRATVQLRG